jgi:hypothetical protein
MVMLINDIPWGKVGWERTLFPVGSMLVDDGTPGPFVVFTGGGEGWALLSHIGR